MVLFLTCLSSGVLSRVDQEAVPSAETVERVPSLNESAMSSAGTASLDPSERRPTGSSQRQPSEGRCTRGEWLSISSDAFGAAALPTEALKQLSLGNNSQDLGSVEGTPSPRPRHKTDWSSMLADSGQVFEHASAHRSKYEDVEALLDLLGCDDEDNFAGGGSCPENKRHASLSSGPSPQSSFRRTKSMTRYAELESALHLLDQAHGKRYGALEGMLHFLEADSES